MAGCPNCGNYMEYIHDHGRWYCRYCRQYPERTQYGPSPQVISAPVQAYPQKPRPEYQPVDDGSRNTNIFWGVFVLGILIFVAALILVLLEPPEDDIVKNGNSEEFSYTVSGNELHIPISDLPDGDAKFYQYHSGSVDIHFFVIKVSNSVIYAAFDACDTCYPEKKGYRQEGNEMVCNECDRPFEISNFSLQGSSCAPEQIDVNIGGGIVSILISDLEDRRYYFE